MNKIIMDPIFQCTVIVLYFTFSYLYETSTKKKNKELAQKTFKYSKIYDIGYWYYNYY